MFSPMEYADSLRIGSVDFVSPNEVKVLLDIESPNNIALNTGTPRPFPRINSYVLLPGDNGFLVAQIEWITIEHSSFPKRKGMQDFGVIDLPFPVRKMSLNPLGVLRIKNTNAVEPEYEFSRGVETFPTVGDPVILPTQKQLRSIVESGENRRVKIGTSPLAANADVSVDPDRLFGRHLAVLGNTGSGKSCSVSGLIRWSIEAAKRETKKESVNARFIILDPNGEYSQTFSGLSGVNIFSVGAPEQAINSMHPYCVNPLYIPIWFWNSAEWCAFTQASAKTQRPTLIQALRAVRDGRLDIEVTHSQDMRRFLRTLVSILTIEIHEGSPWGTFPKNKSFAEKLQNWERELNSIPSDSSASFSSEEQSALFRLNEKIKQINDSQRIQQYPSNLFQKTDIYELRKLVSEAHSAFGGSDMDVFPIDADIPRPFTGEQLLRSIEATAEITQSSVNYIEPLLMRIRTLLSDTRLKNITNCESDFTLEKWLNQYIYNGNTHESSINIIDLSLVPSEVVHIITAVIARMIFEALQRYRKQNNGETLPTTLVMEEAHTFIKRYQSDSEDATASAMCTQVFEKISREGRKFGLGLVLSSQRPSELSPTVLSQCNTFLLHRISNDRDQELVAKLVPDNLRGLLRELPSLPSQRAILLGWASELPVMVHMNSLPDAHKPQSNDPYFWDVWTLKKQRPVEWNKIADEWQQNDVQPKSFILNEDEVADIDLQQAQESDEYELPF